MSEGAVSAYPREEESVSQPVPEPSVGEIRFVPSELAGSLDGVSDELKRRLPDAVVDELLAGARSEEEIAGPGGVLAQLTGGWSSGRSRWS